jgi:hypothetical protein
MTIVNFKIVKIQGAKTVVCSKCGKKRKRQKTFYMTINPWNKNADGTVRDRTDICVALEAEKKEWKQDTVEDCEECPVV